MNNWDEIKYIVETSDHSAVSHCRVWGKKKNELDNGPQCTGAENILISVCVIRSKALDRCSGELAMAAQTQNATFKWMLLLLP